MDTWRNVQNSSVDSEDFIDNQVFPNPAVSVPSDDSVDLTVDINPPQPRYRSTPTKETSIDAITRGVRELNQTYDHHIPAIPVLDPLIRQLATRNMGDDENRAPEAVADHADPAHVHREEGGGDLPPRGGDGGDGGDGGGGGGGGDGGGGGGDPPDDHDEDDEDVSSDEDAEEMNPRRLGYNIGKMATGLVSNIEQVNTLAKCMTKNLNEAREYRMKFADHSDRLDAFMARMTTVMEQQGNMMAALTKTYTESAKREEERVKERKEKENKVDVKGSSLPKLEVQKNKVVSLSEYNAFYRRAMCFINVSQWKQETRQDITNIANAVLASIGTNAAEKTATIEADPETGLYSYTTLEDFFEALKKCVCLESTKDTAWAAFKQRKQAKTEEIHVYLTDCYNLWKQWCGKDPANWQILFDHVLNNLWNKGFSHNFRNNTIPFLTLMGKWHYNHEGWLELSSMLPSQYATWTNTNQPDTSASQSTVEPMQIGNLNKKNGNKNHGQRSNTNKGGSSRNAPAGSQERMTRDSKASDNSKDQKSHRRDNNLCYTCGDSNHLAKNCPLKKKKSNKGGHVNDVSAKSTKESKTSGQVNAIGWFAEEDDLHSGGGDTFNVNIGHDDFFTEWANPWMTPPKEENEVVFNQIEEPDEEDVRGRQTQRNSHAGPRRRTCSVGNAQGPDQCHPRSGPSTA